jgi:hypothetical protein
MACGARDLPTVSGSGRTCNCVYLRFGCGRWVCAVAGRADGAGWSSLCRAGKSSCAVGESGRGSVLGSGWADEVLDRRRARERYHRRTRSHRRPEALTVVAAPDPKALRGQLLIDTRRRGFICVRSSTITTIQDGAESTRASASTHPDTTGSEVVHQRGDLIGPAARRAVTFSGHGVHPLGRACEGCAPTSPSESAPTKASTT